MQKFGTDTWLKYIDGSFSFGPDSKWLYVLYFTKDGRFVGRFDTTTLVRDNNFLVKVPPSSRLMTVSPDGKHL